MSKILTGLLVLGALTLFAADDAPQKKWTNKTDLSAVWTDGNSESGSFGLGNQYAYTMDNASFTWNLSMNRVETTSISLSATGTAENPIFQETRTTEVSTENYKTDLKYSRKFTEKTSWYGALTWERNEPSGFSSRLSPELGIANNWLTGKEKKFTTNYGLSYTTEDALLAEEDESYGSITLGYDFFIKFGNATFTQGFDYAMNVEESNDWRSELDNSLSVSINSSLALKVSLNFDYDNSPHFVGVTLIDGPNSGTTVLYEKENLDATFNASLVINF